MKWKTTLVLLAATIGLGVYVSLVELRHPTTEQRERLAKDVLDVPPDAATQIVLDLPQAKLTLTKHEAEWRLSPQNFRADAAKVSSLLGLANPLAAERVLASTKDKPLDLKSFGLDPPLGMLSLVAQERPVTLLLGDTTPVGDNRYAKVSNRPEVFVIPSALFDAANHPLEDFRDHRLLPFETWQAEQWTLSSPAGTLGLVRTNDVWKLTQPLADVADRIEVGTLLRTLGDLTIARFLDDAPQVEGLTGWGFEAPRMELTLRLKGASRPTILFIGKPLPDDATLVYAKRSDEPSLYAVAAQAVDRLVKDVGSVRAKHCFEFFLADVTKVELQHEGRTWTMTKTEGQWRQDGGEALDTSTVEEKLQAMADLRVSGFADENPSDLGRYGLDTPAGTIRVWTAGKSEPQRLLVGKTLESSDERYGRIEGRTPIVVLPGAVGRFLTLTPEELRAPTAPSAEQKSTPTPAAAPPHPSR